VTQPPDDRTADTPEATRQVAQDGAQAAAPSAPSDPNPEFPCSLGDGVARAAEVQPHVRLSDDPLFRKLRIFSLDPAQPKRDGAIALVKIPYEPLEPGPVGRLFAVDNRDDHRDVRYARVDLDERKALICDGRDPSPTDPQFHQQMVYAVCMNVYAAFKAALGRNVAWGFDRAPKDADADGLLRLRLVPHAESNKNAYYSREEGAIRFGYFRAGGSIEAQNPTGGYIFTCLSHDIIAHELGHALLDGLRSHLLVATRPDVLAFHEAFGDLVAIFQHFAYPEVLLAALRRGGGKFDRGNVLGSIAGQFGFTATGRWPLRTAIEVGDTPRQYQADLEIHELGSVLVSAVFEAFTTIFGRKAERHIRLATAGSGVLPEGALSPYLEQALASEASQLASQFLQLCIRAVDYCPPLDLEFGDYLRALVTADAELIPDDPWAYREALVNAFGRRGVFPSDVRNLAEDSLRWRPPWRPIKIPELSFAKLRFAGDPAQAAGKDELRRQAHALAKFVADRRYREAFGVESPGEQPDGKYGAPRVESIRTARRVGPDGQVLFDLVAEVVQERIVATPTGGQATFLGGATVIIDPEGSVRYLIVKNIKNERRLQQFREYAFGKGAKLWATKDDGTYAPNPRALELVHPDDDGPAAAAAR
jgi:hypothetical protein